VSARRAARFGATRILRRGAVVAGSVAMSDAPSSSEPVAGDITLLIQRAGAGDLQAADRILPLVYDELRKLAAAKMARETPGLTLQPTALVHEAWLRLGGDQQPQWKNRAHFFAAAAEGMRRILIDNARRRRAQRHGGALEKVSANATGFDVAAPQLDDDQLIRLDEALAKLAAHDARKADIVKHHYFVGLTVEEAAEAMGITARTAHRDWAYARVWLFNEMKAAQG
jgi:RNA polymerase sigma factor (TIGR02999 family)